MSRAKWQATQPTNPGNPSLVRASAFREGVVETLKSITNKGDTPQECDRRHITNIVSSDPYRSNAVLAGATNVFWELQTTVFGETPLERTMSGQVPALISTRACRPNEVRVCSRTRSRATPIDRTRSGNIGGGVSHETTQTNGVRAYAQNGFRVTPVDRAMSAHVPRARWSYPCRSNEVRTGSKMMFSHVQKCCFERPLSTERCLGRFNDDAWINRIAPGIRPCRMEGSKFRSVSRISLPMMSLPKQKQDPLDR